MTKISRCSLAIEANTPEQVEDGQYNILTSGQMQVNKRK